MRNFKAYLLSMLFFSFSFHTCICHIVILKKKTRSLNQKTFIAQKMCLRTHSPSPTLLGVIQWRQERNPEIMRLGVYLWWLAYRLILPSREKLLFCNISKYFPGGKGNEIYNFPSLEWKPMAPGEIDPKSLWSNILFPASQGLFAIKSPFTHAFQFSESLGQAKI